MPRVLCAVVVMSIAAAAAAQQTRLASGGSVTLSVKGGFDVAERRSAAGELLWYVVLRPAGGAPLRVVDEGSIVRVLDGAFVRVSEADIPKPDPNGKSQLMPPLLSIQRSGQGAPPFATGMEVVMAEGPAAVLQKQGWIYAAFGKDPRNAPQVLIRLSIEQPKSRLILQNAGGRWVAGAFGLDAIDDGVLTIAKPMPEWHAREIVEREKNRAAVRSGATVPPITAARWINSKPLDLNELRGKVVMLDFWGVWCGPCVGAIPKLHKLIEEVNSPDFVLIAVHSADQAAKLDDFLKKTPYRVPIAVDTGKTAHAYGVEKWPTYVLIDRSGKVVNADAVPTADSVRKLLSAGSAARP